jgi:hypothetical protein
VAKAEKPNLGVEENSPKMSPNVSNKTREIFSEGNSLNLSTKSSRIIARKGAPDNVTIASVSPSPEADLSLKKIDDNSTTTVSTTKSIIFQSSTGTSVTTAASTQKAIKKPLVTYSAEDNPQITDSEKNINYNVSKLEDNTQPRIEFSTDRWIKKFSEEKKQTRSSYILFMGLMFVVPMTFTLIHMLYKKVKNWLEVREYQRVVSTFLLKKRRVGVKRFDFLGFSCRRHVHKLILYCSGFITTLPL